ncbi:MAG: sulfatase [Candidatus Sungbacteria bacterium]|nr:sulfatase [Candidatus Sungbacteria bacterium]
MKKLNVILIGIDTLRADHLGCYGYNRLTSPTIDELAKKGVIFKNCFAQAPATAPSFMSIMTSRYPTYHGIGENIGGTGRVICRMYALDPAIPTLASILKKNGYQTAAFTTGGNVHPLMGFGRGFDYYSVKHGWTGNFRLDAGKRILLSDDPRRWIRENARENFFLFLHTYAVHNPWDPPKRYRKFFVPEAEERLIVPLFRNKTKADRAHRKQLSEQTRGDTYHTLHSFVNPEKPEDVDCLKALYDGAIRYVDECIAALLETVNALGLSENTIIVFTSDHGEEFMEHGMLSHLQLYNELLRVPLIIRAPNLKKSVAVDQIVRSIDILPTILELLHIRRIPPVHGVSLIPASRKNLNLLAIAETETRGCAVQNKKYKYIYPRYKSYKIRTDELYDLEKDPEEKNNILFEKPRIAEKMFSLFEEELHRENLTPPRRKIMYLIK